MTGSVGGAIVPAVLAGAAVAVAGGLRAGPGLRLQDAVPGRGPLPGRPARDAVPWVRLPGHPVVSSQTRLLRRVLPVLVVAGAALLALGPAAALLAAGGVLAVTRVLAARRHERERALERGHAAEACAALAADLRAGRPAGAALALAADVAHGPFRTALQGAAAAAAWGGEVPAALLDPESLGASAVPEVLRGLAACWQVCGRAGSGLALSVERLADGLRARQVQERGVAAALAGPRASAALLGGLPLGGIALAAGLGAHPLHVLLHTPLGLGCTAIGTGLDALGLWWTGRIVQRARGAGR